MRCEPWEPSTSSSTQLSINPPVSFLDVTRYPMSRSGPVTDAYPAVKMCYFIIQHKFLEKEFPSRMFSGAPPFPIGSQATSSEELQQNNFLNTQQRRKWWEASTNLLGIILWLVQAVPMSFLQSHTAKNKSQSLPRQNAANFCWIHTQLVVHGKGGLIIF